ncbi:MAG: DUF3187 family protein [Fimbriimonas sp.]
MIQIPDLGPIETLNHRMASLAFYRFAPREATVADQRSWRFEWNQANDFRLLSKGSLIVEEDYEVTRLNIVRQVPFARGDLTVRLPLLSRGAGFLDPIIDGWHKNVLGWSDPIRNSTPFGRSTIQMPGSRFGSATGIGDVSATYTKPVCRDLSVSGAVKLPIGNARQLLGSGGLDAGLAVNFSRQLGPAWRVHALAGGVAQSPAKDLDSTRGLVQQAALSLVYASNSRDRWIVQWQSEASPTVTGVPGADASHRLVTFGYRRRLSAHESLDAFFMEDRDLFNGRIPEGANTGPDFSIGFYYSIRR